MNVLRCKSALCRLSCVLQQCCYLSRWEYIIYCYEPGVHVYTDTYHYTTFPALFLSPRCIWKSMTPVCKHPKTITIVADNHRFAPVCVSVCESVCRRDFCTSVGVGVHKHTHTRFRAMCETAGNPRATQNGCSLPAPQLEAYCPICVCPCCHRKQSLKHPLVSIGYPLHKIQTTHTQLCSCKLWLKATFHNAVIRILTDLISGWSRQSRYCAALICIQDAKNKKKHAGVMYFPFLFLISEACHVWSHLASTENAGQPRACRPPDVPLCRVSDLPSPKQEGDVRLPAKIWPLWPERRRRRGRRDGQQIHGYWTHR